MAADSQDDDLDQPQSNPESEQEELKATAAPADDLTSIDAVIEDLAAKQASLSKFIDRNRDQLDIPIVARLLSIHAQTASRLGRLLRDQRALSGEAADGIAGAIAQALDELSSELGVDL